MIENINDIERYINIEVIDSEASDRLIMKNILIEDRNIGQTDNRYTLHKVVIQRQRINEGMNNLVIERQRNNR